jgi:DNA-binding transcriptional regulator YiaG
MKIKDIPPLQRVHRKLTDEQIDAMRESIAKHVPESQAAITDLIKAMRLATQMSQREYAHLCDISLPALQKLERGEPAERFQAGTLDKLLRPFGYRLGVVKAAEQG